MPLFSLGEVNLFVPLNLLAPSVERSLNTGTYEKDEAQMLRRVVKPGQRVLDLGSGLGYTAALCCKITDPEKVMTVEANPRLLRLVEGNLRKNGAADAKVRHGAIVGPRFTDDQVVFHCKKRLLGASIAGPDNRSRRLRKVPALHLDELFSEHRPDVVQIDIEGAEAQIFDSPWPAFVSRVVMETHPKKYTADVIARIHNCMGQSGLELDRALSKGKMLSFVRL